jgi:hypothetical protein
VKIDSVTRRILILVDGEKEPSIYFSFNEKSEMFNKIGSPITFDDLEEQQKLRLWAAGDIATSMPAYAMSRRLELIIQKE